MSRFGLNRKVHYFPKIVQNQKYYTNNVFVFQYVLINIVTSLYSKRFTLIFSSNFLT